MLAGIVSFLIAILMLRLRQGQLQIWIEHSTLISEDETSREIKKLFRHLKINTTFEDVQVMLKRWFDFSTGFRFSKISVECFVHICNCPWFRIDDPLDAVAVHMGGGCLGVICVPFFKPPDTGRLISNHVFVIEKTNEKLSTNSKIRCP